MIVFNCTKAAANYLFGKPKPHNNASPVIKPVPDFDIQHSGTNDAPVSQWMVSHKKIRETDYLFISHIKHRTTFIIGDVQSGELQHLVNQLVERITDQLLYWLTEMPFSISIDCNRWIHNYLLAHKTVYFCQRHDAGTQSSINLAINQVHYFLEEEGRLPTQEEEIELDLGGNSFLQNLPSQKRAIVPAQELLKEFLRNHMGVTGKYKEEFCAVADDIFRQRNEEQMEAKQEAEMDDAFAAITAQRDAYLREGNVEKADMLNQVLEMMSKKRQ